MLATALGASRLLARPGAGRLCVLNPPAAALWELRAAGLDAAALADLLTQHFGLSPPNARAQVDSLLDDWHLAGLTATGPPRPAPPDGPYQVAARPTPAPIGALCLAVAETRISLDCADADLLASLAAVVQSLRADATDLVDYRLRLAGNPAQWRLWLDATPCAEGADADSATVATVEALVELACRTNERLLIVHGAGLVAADGRGLLLIAPGGSGKTTLAAGLNAAGLTLLGDDVVPVTPDGQLLGLGMPLCLKPGSWPVLAGCRPELPAIPAVSRYGQTVRYLPPRGPRMTAPVPTGWLLFPHYRPGHPPGLRALTPEEALRGIVESESVIRDLTQSKLERLARWIESALAYDLTYPDLDSGLRLVHQLLNGGGVLPA